MPPAARPRKRNGSPSALPSPKRQTPISDAAIVRGVAVEFDRTLPFWRCFTDLRRRVRRKPAVTRRATQLLCRIPCEKFQHVNVVWARTRVQMRVNTPVPRSRTKCVSNGNTEENRRAQEHTRAAPSLPSVRTEAYTIDTFHFVHDDAHRAGLGGEHSFHVQSVILRDAPAVLQCVAGSMVCFSFLVYTSMRLVYAYRTRFRHTRAFWAAIQAQMQDYEEQQRQQRGETATKSSSDASSSVFSLSAAKYSTPCTERKRERPLTNAALPAPAFHSSLPYASLRDWCPPPTSRILVLGMGGNSMALALRTVLGPDALIEIVELEPAVVAACLNVGTLSDTDPNTKVYLRDVGTCFRHLPDKVYDFIYMDIFEPMEATMKNLHPWVKAARTKLTAGGMLVMNEHQLPSAERLAPYGKLFGHGNVQAVNLKGWRESVVVCVAPGNPETDGCSLKLTKSYADTAYDVYETLLPGWLPHYSWLTEAKTHHFEGVPCRLWAS